MSMTQVRVEGQSGFPNPEAQHAAHKVGVAPDNVTVISTYYLEGLDPEHAEAVVDLLRDSVTQQADIAPRTDWDNPHKIEVSPKAGVTDTASAPIFDVLAKLGIHVQGVQTTTEHLFADSTDKETLAKAEKSLANPTVEQVRREAPRTLEVHGEAQPVQHFNLPSYNDGELERLSKSRKLALSLSEMKAIQQESVRLDRPMTDAELEAIGSAHWSEHCSHKVFKANVIDKDGNLKHGYFQRIMDRSKPYLEERGVLSAGSDNSGVWAFYDGQALCIKLETHNGPMNIEPYGGSATGSGGVFRDIVGTGKGARVINSIHIQCLGPLDSPESEIPEGCLSPSELYERSVAGVRDYGNRMGIPTNDVSFHTDPRLRGKGTVIVGALGIMPEINAKKGAPRHGDLVVATGGKTGLDGVHGANFSGESADGSTATVHSGAVQIGNPIEEKKVFDAILEASERGLIKAMTDCGAAGFASAIGEMGEDIGVQVELANVPLKYAGLSAWEIYISESQERMVLAVDPADYSELASVFAKHGSNCDILGTFGSPEGEAPTLHVEHNGETVIHLDYNFIRNGVPLEPQIAIWQPPTIIEKDPAVTSLGDALNSVLRNGNVASTEPVVRQYDHEVQGTSALKPYDGKTGHGRNNAVVLTPTLGKPYAVVEAHGTNPTITELDPVRGTKWVYAKAVSNLVAVGGNPDEMVVANNYISPSPTERVLGAIDLSVDTLTLECITEFHSPIISGKDSNGATFKLGDGALLEAPYNLTITVAGKLPDVEKTISSDIKTPGSVLVLVGAQDLEAMGGSIYYDESAGASASVPDINMSELHQTTRTLHKAIQSGIVMAAQAVSEGGIITTVTQMLIGGDCGADLNINDRKQLFNETTGCFVVEVPDEMTASAQFAGVPYQVIGTTKDDKTLTVAGETMDIDELLAVWQKPLEDLFT